MSEWISVKDRLPDDAEPEQKQKFCIAYHSVHGVGVAWIYRYKCPDIIEEAKEEFGCKYICTFEFIHSTMDGNMLHDLDAPEDVMECGTYPNLGEVTHWMALPPKPQGKNE